MHIDCSGLRYQLVTGLDEVDCKVVWRLLLDLLSGG